MRIFGFAGWSGSGKTTLVEQIIPRLTARGHRVAMVKHAHHDFDVDQPGKDSWPVTGASYILVHKAQDAAKGKEVLKFFDWSYKNGAASAAELDYVPMPAPVIKLVQTLKDEPERLAQFRSEMEALIARFFSHNRVRQTFLMTRAVKR